MHRRQNRVARGIFRRGNCSDLIPETALVFQTGVSQIHRRKGTFSDPLSEKELCSFSEVVFQCHKGAVVVMVLLELHFH